MTLVRRAVASGESVGANLQAGSVDAVAVVATSAGTERAVVFVQAREETPVPDATLVDYLPGPLGDEHVLASAAIPVFSLTQAK